MSVWQELGIAEDSDAKTVKRAYAKRVKVTRPEDDAEAFQRLHSAYKEALASAKANARRAPEAPVMTASFDLQVEAPEPVDLVEPEGNQEPEKLAISEQYDEEAVGAPPLKMSDFDEKPCEGLIEAANRDAEKRLKELSEQYEYEREVAERQAAAERQQLEQQRLEEQKRIAAEAEQERLERLAYQAELDNMGKKIRQLIKDVSLRDSQKSWQFLLESPYILDPDFNDDLACLVWRGIYQFKFDYVQAQIDAGFSASELTQTPISLATIAYLDEFFNWRSKLAYIAGQIGDEAAGVLYDHLEEMEMEVGQSQQLAAVRGGVIAVDNNAHEQPSKANAKEEDKAFAKMRGGYNLIIGVVFLVLLLGSIGFISVFFNWWEQSGTEGFEPLVAAAVLIGYIGFIFTGMVMKKRWAVYLSTTIALPLLFAYPMGTGAAVLMLWYTPRAGRYCQLHTS